MIYDSVEQVAQLVEDTNVFRKQVDRVAKIVSEARGRYPNAQLAVIELRLFKILKEGKFATEQGVEPGLWVEYHEAEDFHYGEHAHKTTVHFPLAYLTMGQSAYKARDKEFMRLQGILDAATAQEVLTVQQEHAKKRRYEDFVQLKAEFEGKEKPC